MKKLLLPLLVASFCYGQSLETLLLKVKRQNLDLREMQEAIMIGDEKTALADTWENPTLGLGANDLLLDDITSRDREPMQTHFVTLSQKIPLGDKVALKRGIALADKEIAKNLYHDRLQKITSALLGYGYKVAIIEKKLALIARYQRNVKRLKRLHTKRFEVGKSPQSAIEDTKILSKKLTIKKRKLLTMKRAFLYKIASLVYEDVASVEVPLSMDKSVVVDLEKHPIMIGENLKLQKAIEALKLAKANRTPDVKVGIGYFQREDRSDYLALNAGFELPVRGKEAHKVNIALLKVSQAKKRRSSRRFTWKREVDILQELMEDSLENYRIIKQEILPKKRHISKLLEQEIFTKQSSSTTLLINLNETILLELDAYEQMDSYFSAYAKLVYFGRGLS